MVFWKEGDTIGFVCCHNTCNLSGGVAEVWILLKPVNVVEYSWVPFSDSRPCIG